MDFSKPKQLPEKTELFLKILVPVFGILFLDWNMGNIFALFWVELFMYWAITTVRIFVAGKNISFFKRLFQSLVFLFTLIVVVLIFTIVLGNFFDGSNPLMRPTITRNNLLYIIVSGLLSYGYVAFLKKNRPRLSSSDIIKEAEYKVGVTFVILLVILLPFSLIANKYFENYLMITAILCAKYLVEYLLNSRKKKILR